MKNEASRVWRTLAWATLLGVAAVATSGCTRHVSRDIADDGAAGEVIFPATDRIVLEEGTFPTRDSLSQIGPGVTKDQLYDLIGRPHFREGIAAREWDYLFHFREGDKVTTCQYKVIFDREYRGRSFHWSPAGCADLLKERQAGIPAPVAKRYSLSADALFAFGRSEAADLLPGGREEIARVASELLAEDARGRIRVTGHTDEIGAEQANQALSQSRAETVRLLLVEGGVQADQIVAEGRGESEAVRQCAASLSRAARIECLQPNRRVEIASGGAP